MFKSDKKDKNEVKNKLEKLILERKNKAFLQKGFATKGSKTQKTFSNKPKNMNRRTGR